jgi:magnesium transporter
MNFDVTPEPTQYGYFVAGVIVAVCGALFWRFRRSGWL